MTAEPTSVATTNSTNPYPNILSSNRTLPEGGHIATSRARSTGEFDRRPGLSSGLGRLTSMPKIHVNAHLQEHPDPEQRDLHGTDIFMTMLNAMTDATFYLIEVPIH